MTPFTRRSIMQFIGGAAVSAPKLVESAPRLLALAEPIAAAATAVAPGAGQPIGNGSPLSGALYRQLSRLRDDAEGDSYVQQSLRINGLDSDIACLRSPSPAWKARKQLARLREERDLLTRIRRALWPDSI